MFTRGNAGFFGSLGALRLQGPIVAMAATPDGRGYWLAALDGGVFAFGDAGFFGSMGATHLNQPIVGMASTPDGKGYWLVAADGGIFAFGDAPFLGSMGGTPLVAPVTGMAADRRRARLLAGGRRRRHLLLRGRPVLGSTGGTPLNDPVVGMAPSPDDAGYLLVSTDGGIFGFGAVIYYGSLGGGLGGDPADVPPIAGIALTPDGARATGCSSPTASTTRSPTPRTRAAHRHHPSHRGGGRQPGERRPGPGSFCNPYGPCEEWCALFATWVWGQAGVPIPSYPFTGEHLRLGGGQHRGAAPDGSPLPGDAVLYGTGRGRRRPRSTSAWSCRCGRTAPSSPSKGTPAGAQRLAGGGHQRSLPAVAVVASTTGCPSTPSPFPEPYDAGGTDAAAERIERAGQRDVAVSEASTEPVVRGRSPGLRQRPGPLEEQVEVALPRVADGPVDLQRHPGRLGGGVRGVGLGHRRRPRAGGLALVERPGRAVDHGPGELEGDLGPGQQVLDRLEAADGLPELVAAPWRSRRPW